MSQQRDLISHQKSKKLIQDQVIVVSYIQHISHTPLKLKLKRINMENQNQTQTWTDSLFIPRINYSITKPDLKRFFEVSYPLGTVSRIDFVAFNNNHGSGRRAFVHFSEFTNHEVKQMLLQDQKCDICIGGHNLRLIINEKPVPETKLNLNQVAYNTDFLGEELKIQQEKIEELEKKVKTIEEEHMQWKQYAETQMMYMMDVMSQIQSQMHIPISVSLTSGPPAPPPPMQMYPYIPFPMVGLEQTQPQALSLIHPDELNTESPEPVYAPRYRVPQPVPRN